MKQFLSSEVFPVLLLIALCGNTLAAERREPRERLSFNNDWSFVKGDPEGAGDSLSYAQMKPWMLPTGADFAIDNKPAPRPEGNPGSDIAYVRPDFDDSAWRKLNLPHDWGIEGPFNQEYPGETAKLPWWGFAWYRKHFTLPASDRGRRVYLDVDGAMAYANVWLNGKYVGGWGYGYASWRVDLTPHIKPGAENVIAIRLDNPRESSRWYPGGGIYRNVWLVKTAPVHVAHWGTFVSAPDIAPDSAAVRVETRVENHNSVPNVVSIKTELRELDDDGRAGRSVGEFTVNGVEIPASGTQSNTVQLRISKPRLWTLETPRQYVAVTSIEQNGRVLDRYETPFGIRKIRFDAQHGFFLNDRHVRLNGVCMHHDLGALGSALNLRALERQIEILQEMGCNAIRTSHNPPAPELLDLCDRMGMLVIDEAFDCWARRKKQNDYARLFPDWHEMDWRAQLRRDRNHPSIILWSTGNEIPEQGSTAGHEISKTLTRITHQEDPTRPVTAGCNNIQAGHNGFQKTVDVFGYNYKPQEYARFREANPYIPLYSSESSSCVSSRGEYFFPVSTNKAEGLANFHVSSYDLYAPRWATPPDWEFTGQDRNPFVAGEFVWTGFDYLGEPTPYNADMSNLINYTDPEERARAERELQEMGRIRTPSRSSYFGIVDLAGFKKDRFYLYQARWRPELRMAHILPHWNWPERVGQATPVHVYTSGDEAELFLNGKSLGRRTKEKFEYRLKWDDVVYEPGELRVVTYKNGKRWATAAMKTTGPAAKLLLEADRDRIAADRKDLSFVTATISDESGLLVPRSHNLIRFKVEGPGEIVATDNGDPTSHEPFQSPERKAFNGLALAIVRSTGEPGRIRLIAESDGLDIAAITIRAR